MGQSDCQSLINLNKMYIYVVKMYMILYEYVSNLSVYIPDHSQPL